MAIKVVSMYRKSFKKDTSLDGKRFSSYSKLVFQMPHGAHVTVQHLDGTWKGWYRTVERTGEVTYSIQRRPVMEY